MHIPSVKRDNIHNVFESGSIPRSINIRICMLENVEKARIWPTRLIISSTLADPIR